MLDVRESPLQMIHSVSKKGTGKVTWVAGVKKKKKQSFFTRVLMLQMSLLSRSRQEST